MLPTLKDRLIVRVDDAFQQVLQSSGFFVVRNQEQLKFHIKFFLDGEQLSTTCFNILVCIENDKVDTALVRVYMHFSYIDLVRQFLIPAGLLLKFTSVNDTILGSLIMKEVMIIVT